MRQFFLDEEGLTRDREGEVGMSRDGYPTSERVYAALKQDLLGGRYRPGERIDAALAADRLGTSITPIRTALYRLAGERLVEARPSEGFFRAALTEAGLRDLYIWNGHILALVLRLWSHDAGGPPPNLDGLEPALATAELFRRVGERTRNEHCVHAIEALNDQLHVARRVEPAVLSDIDAELTDLAIHFADPRTATLRRAIARYHLRRLRAAPDIVRLAQQKPAP